MAEQITYWTTLWVDSMDRDDWQERAKEALSMDGVEEIRIDPESGQVKVKYDFREVTPFHLHAHLRAAGL